MKKYFSLNILLSFSVLTFAQIKSETIKVSGSCSDCKKHIETAAKAAGAATAVWNKDTKALLVNYDASKTSSIAIENKIAVAGYDTPDVKATDASYKKLDECCQYDRKSSGESASLKMDDKLCCKDAASCKKMADECCKGDMSNCKTVNHTCCNSKSCSSN